MKIVLKNLFYLKDRWSSNLFTWKKYIKRLQKTNNKLFLSTHFETG